MEWYKNGLRVPDPPLSIIQRTQYGNGSVKSVLTLKRVKYRDRGSTVSCTAWYPSLSINSTRNIHLLVHGMSLWYLLFAVLLICKTVRSHDG